MRLLTYIHLLALDWMIDKPLTPDKKKSNKPIEDKHLTTWCSWRQIRTLLKSFHSVAKQAYERESSGMS